MKADLLELGKAWCKRDVIVLNQLRTKILSRLLK